MSDDRAARLQLLRYRLWRRRVTAAHIWRDAARVQAAVSSEAVRQILDHGDGGR